MGEGGGRSQSHAAILNPMKNKSQDKGTLIVTQANPRKAVEGLDVSSLVFKFHSFLEISYRLDFEIIWKPSHK